MMSALSPPAENTQLQACVEDLKNMLYEARAQHFSQLEEIRCVVLPLLVGGCG